MSLAVSLAREATDAVPVVKQTLGVAVRIMALAEKIDRDREALHALADRSLQLCRRVTNVMDGRTPDARILSSLERILAVFDKVEAFMKKHVARRSLHRAISYTLTVPQHVDRLTSDLENALQELVVVTLLDVNHHVHATQFSVDDGSRYAGEFRLLRHCEVDKLELIREDRDDSEGSNLVARYHRARVDGQNVVVRYFAGNSCQDSRGLYSEKQRFYERMISQDDILEELSTVHNSHQHIARIYGWSKGSIHDRFTVFKSAGFRPLGSVMEHCPHKSATMLQFAFKLAGAARHLRAMGILWKPPRVDEILIDDQFEPVIGLNNDLCRQQSGAICESEGTPDMSLETYALIDKVAMKLSDCLRVFEVQAASTGYLRKRACNQGVTLCPNCSKRLSDRKTRSNLNRRIYSIAYLLLRKVTKRTTWSWSLVATLDADRQCWSKSAAAAWYEAHYGECDAIKLQCKWEDAEGRVYDMYYIYTRCAGRDTTRRSAEHEEPPREGFFVGIGDAGDYRVIE